jgi:hypothetical protein
MPHTLSSTRLSGCGVRTTTSASSTSLKKLESDRYKRPPAALHRRPGPLRSSPSSAPPPSLRARSSVPDAKVCDPRHLRASASSAACVHASPPSFSLSGPSSRWSPAPFPAGVCRRCSPAVPDSSHRFFLNPSCHARLLHHLPCPASPLIPLHGRGQAGSLQIVVPSNAMAAAAPENCLQFQFRQVYSSFTSYLTQLPILFKSR